MGHSRVGYHPSDFATGFLPSNTTPPPTITLTNAIIPPTTAMQIANLDTFLDLPLSRAFLFCFNNVAEASSSSELRPASSKFRLKT